MMNGSKISETMGLCSRKGQFEILKVDHSARLVGKWGYFRDFFFDLLENNGMLSVRNSIASIRRFL